MQSTTNLDAATNLSQDDAQAIVARLNRPPLTDKGRVSTYALASWGSGYAVAFTNRTTGDRGYLIL